MARARDKVLRPDGAYVYEHWRPDTGSCFYVGKGRAGRANKVRRNYLHANVVGKLERLGMTIDVKIVKSGLSDVEAYELEVSQIALRRSQGHRLCNLTDGGFGTVNPSVETRQKMSAAAKARTVNSFRGKQHSDATKAAWSEKRKGRKLSDEHRAKISAGLLINNGFRGKTHSPETRAKISAHNKTRDLSHLNFNGRNHSESAKSKIGAALKGRVLSPETRASISASKRAGASHAKT